MGDGKFNKAIMAFFVGFFSTGTGVSVVNGKIDWASLVTAFAGGIATAAAVYRVPNKQDPVQPEVIHVNPMSPADALAGLQNVQSQLNDVVNIAGAVGEIVSNQIGDIQSKANDVVGNILSMANPTIIQSVTTHSDDIVDRLIKK